MNRYLRVYALSISIVSFTVVPLGAASAGCFASDVAKALASKLGLPTSRAELLLLALTPSWTAGPSDDQITTTSPKFSDQNEKQLLEQDATLDQAQQFVSKSLPRSKDNQTCIENLQQMRDEIKREVEQRHKENIPPSRSVKELEAFKAERSQEAATRGYSPNGLLNGFPQKRTGPAGDGGGGSVPIPPPGSGYCQGFDCVYRR
jgi:hypothetical protein